MNRRSNTVTAAVIVVVAIVLDQLTKWWAESELDGNRVIEVLPTLEFDLAYNPGFSFGTGAGFGRWIGVLVIGMCVFLGYLIATAETRGRTIIVACILGGAIGNLIDRVFRAEDGFLSGEVVDFIDVTWYAVFNVADMFVVCGAIAFGVYEVWLNRHEAALADSTDADAVDVENEADEPTVDEDVESAS